MSSSNSSAANEDVFVDNSYLTGMCRTLAGMRRSIDGRIYDTTEADTLFEIPIGMAGIFGVYQKHDGECFKLETDRDGEPIVFCPIANEEAIHLLMRHNRVHLIPKFFGPGAKNVAAWRDVRVPLNMMPCIQQAAAHHNVSPDIYVTRALNFALRNDRLAPPIV